MKDVVYVREEVLSQAIYIFKKNNVEVYGAPYEADFQLVHWEMSGFTDGMLSTDSDIFLLGSNMMIDALNTDRLGKCFIYCRREIMSSDTFATGSSKWSHDDLLIYVYGGLQGCDWIQRLYGLKQTRINEFMSHYRSSLWNGRSKEDQRAMLPLKPETRKHEEQGSRRQKGKPGNEKLFRFGSAVSTQIFVFAFTKSSKKVSHKNSLKV